MMSSMKREWSNPERSETRCERTKENIADSTCVLAMREIIAYS